MSKTNADRLTPTVDSPPPARQVPLWRAVAVAVILAVALGVVAGATAYVAQSRSNSHTDRRIERLEADLAERRKAAAEANARRDQQLAEVGRLVCAVFNRVQPRDAEVERIRAMYRCDQLPQPQPSPSVLPSPRPS